MLPTPRAPRARLVLVLGVLAAATPVHATPPRAPLEIRLSLDDGGVVWAIEAATDVAIDGQAWQSVPAGAVDTGPALPPWMAAGTRAAGRVACRAGTRWAELRVRGHSAAGAWTIGAGARRGPPGLPRPIAVAPKPRAPHAGALPYAVDARILYEDRLVDARGYTGAVQLLPLRLVDAALVDAESGHVLRRGSLDAEGRLRLALAEPVGGAVLLELESSTRNQPSVRLAVLDPEALTAEALARARPHVVVSVPFLVDSTGVDLGTLVLRDPDGSGPVQAFHIVDVALDAWEALASDAFLGTPPGAADSLRFLWGSGLPTRTTAYGGGIVEVASPGSGDTDGWSDAILLHEIGHFVAERRLGDRNPGGIHLLGDVEQDLRLAWSEGWATAFACWVRAHRSSRPNLAGEPMDTGVALFVNVGLPPPEGHPGGLQYVWDVERNTLGDQPLSRDGTGSETNVAGVLWDAVDDAATQDGLPGDDDSTAVDGRTVWAALGRLRDLQAPGGATFEDFFRSWSLADPAGGALAALLRAARIEYATDDAEPDSESPPVLVASHSTEAAGGVALSEIVPGPRIAVEIVNRSGVPVDLGGWTLVARSNTSSTNPSLTHRLPAGWVLGPGGRAVVRKGGRARDDGASDRFAPNWTVPWFPGVEGACILFDAHGAAVDFVRWTGLDGTASTIEPPAGSGWTGDLRAAPFGSSLARRPDVPDRDRAEDWVAGDPTLGSPNDAGGVHRTFYPAGDVDVVHFALANDGVVTLLTRRLRSGAAPRLELWNPGAGRPLVVVPPDAARAGTAALTLQLASGERLEARCVQAGSTGFGSYDLALFVEPDAALPLPPHIVGIDVGVADGHGAVELDWRNAARYDSIVVRAGPDPDRRLAGTATRWSADLPAGRQPVELVAHAGGRPASPVRLVIAVEPWPATFSEPFDSLRTEIWERSGDWDVVSIAGGRNEVLALSPGGAYPDDAASALRLKSAVVPGPNTVLRFEHVCIVRPEDRAELEITSDWGQSWESLGRWDWNAHRGSGELADWHDGVVDSSDWVEEHRPLAAWAGRPVQIRWRFESDIHGRAAGWFIDALAIEAPAATPPAAFHLTLGANVPNPFNPTTTIHFDITQPADVLLGIYDVRGRLLRVLLDGPRSAGPQTVVWNGSDGRGRVVASGVYLAWLRAGGQERTRRLVLIR